MASIFQFSKKLFTLLDLCVSSLRRGHANLLCIVPILTDDPRRESDTASKIVWPGNKHLPSKEGNQLVLRKPLCANRANTTQCFAKLRVLTLVCYPEGCAAPSFVQC